MPSLLLQLLPLALGAAVSPTLLMVEVLALSTRTAALLRGWLVAAGATLALGAYVALGLLAGAGISGRHRPHHAIDASIDLLAALLLAWLLLHQWIARRRGRTGTSLSERLDDASSKTFFIAGLLLMCTNFSTLILVMPALRLITRSELVLGDRSLAVALLMAIALMPVLLPVGLVSALGKRAQPALDGLNRVVSRWSYQISLALELIFLAYFLVKGIGALSRV